jgi:hypothetical protein
MRAFLAFFVPVLCALYLIDKYQFNTRYTDALLAQGSGIVQQYEQQLKDWLRRL